jgi:hypothetical protein
VAALAGGLAAVAALALLIGVRGVPELDLVRATVEPFGDRLRVITRWHADGAIDAVRVSVNPVGTAGTMSTRLSGEAADTVIVDAPPSGGTHAGTSCVVPLRGGEAGTERCTPWQFVRPSAQSAAGDAAQIVVQPAGLQVDPDLDGRCASWQASNPGRSPWIEVNRRAVAACTGPNGKPTIAQFCAFAILPDGERILTDNSRGNAYCEELFTRWAAQRAI